MVSWLLGLNLVLRNVATTSTLLPNVSGGRSLCMFAEIEMSECRVAVVKVLDRFCIRKGNCTGRAQVSFDLHWHRGVG